jgi:hypothetical protein
MTGQLIIPRSEIIPGVASLVLPALIAAAGGLRVPPLSRILHGDDPQPPYAPGSGRAVSEFLAWCEQKHVAAIQPIHVATWIEAQTHTHAAPTVKQRLAALRHLLDWLVTGHVIEANPAHAVRSPSHAVRSGRTPFSIRKRPARCSTAST